MSFGHHRDRAIRDRAHHGVQTTLSDHQESFEDFLRRQRHRCRGRALAIARQAECLLSRDNHGGELVVERRGYTYGGIGASEPRR